MLWKHGLPLLVDNVNLHGDWSPEHLKRVYGNASVEVFSTHGQEKGDVQTLSQFLDNFVKLSGSNDADPVRVKVCVSKSRALW